MRNVKDRLSGYLFDPWYHVGEKRLKLLKKSWAGFFREHCLPVLPVENITSRFHETMGRPSKEVYTAIGAVILQQIFNKSDEETMYAIAFDGMWQYALDIPEPSEDAAYLCPRTLWSYRTMATEENFDEATFDKITDAIIKYFNKDTGKQRIDSVHIHSNMKKLGRVGIFARTIKAFLIDLERRFPSLSAEIISEEMRERYVKKGMGCFSRVKPSEAERTLKTLSEDLLFLVEHFLTQDEVNALKSFQLLQRVLHEQCEVTGDDEEKKVEVKPAKEVPSDSLQNPSDPDATYDGHKGQGYQVQVMETYTKTSKDEKKDETIPEVITYVEVQPAHESDAHSLIPALESTQERHCEPDALLADSLYGSDDNVEAAAERGVEVVAPAMGSEDKKKKLHLTDFTVDENEEIILKCPAGQAPVDMKDMHNGTFRASFDVGVCQACPHRNNCPTRVGKHTAHLFYKRKQVRLAIRRNKEKTDIWLDNYRMRAGIEGTMSRYKSQTGAGRLRVRGFENVRFAAVMKAIGINILRAAKAMAAILSQEGSNERGFQELFLRFSYFWSSICSILSIFIFERKRLVVGL